MKKINVLIVDDHALIREGYQLILKKHKTHIDVVGEASSGAKALEFLAQTEIDVVLLDITMPDLDGADLTKIILEKYPTIKILILTMHNEESYVVKMVSLGVHGYLLKDSTHAELITAINTVYEGKKYYSNEISTMMLDQFLNRKNKDISKNNATPPSFTEKELEVVSLVVKGLTSHEIALKLGTSNRTIDAHRRSVMKKLNIRNTAELVRYAIMNNLVA